MGFDKLSPNGGIDPQGGIYGSRIGIQIKRSAQPRNQERQRGRERIAHAHAKQMRLIIQAAMQPAAQHAALVHEAEAAHDAGELIFKAFWAVSRHRICLNCYEFHSVQLPMLPEAQQCLGIVGRAKPEL